MMTFKTVKADIKGSKIVSLENPLKVHKDQHGRIWKYGAYGGDGYYVQCYYVASYYVGKEPNIATADFWSDADGKPHIHKVWERHGQLDCREYFGDHFSDIVAISFESFADMLWIKIS